MFTSPILLVLWLFGIGAQAQTYSATYLPSNAPNQTEQGQSGTNQCGNGTSQTSECQNAYLNSVDDFCVFAPPDPGPGSVIGNTERFEVAWCIKSGYGTRVIPDGTISGAHFVQTPDYVQITGVGDLTKINIPAGDEGGELDPHGADGNGNPIGGLVFSSAFGQLQQLHEWTNFVSATEFCFRGCKDGPNAPALCEHIYDVMGCSWNMPGDYSNGTFDRCAGDSGEPMGVYGTSTFHQGDPVTPSAHPAPASSSCTPLTSIGNGLAVSGAPISTTSAVGTPIPPITLSPLPSSSPSLSPSVSSSVPLVTVTSLTTSIVTVNASSSLASLSSQASSTITGSSSSRTVASQTSSSASPSNTAGAAIIGARVPAVGALVGVVVVGLAGVMGV